MLPVSIVIPNYNGAHLLQKNLPSVIQFARVHNPETIIIVVDDGSSDHSVEILAAHFPQVEVVVHAKTKAFPRR